MTTATKLRLGFGVLIALFALSSILTIYRFQSLQARATEEVGKARDRRNEAVYLVLLVDAFDLAVRTYTQTGDAEYSKQATDRAQEVDKHIVAYESFAQSQKNHEYAAGMANLWAPVKASGESILNASAPGRDDFVRLASQRSELGKYLVAQVVPEAVHSYATGSDAFQRNFRFVTYSALGLLAVGIAVAFITSWAVGRGIVTVEDETRAGRERLRVTLTSIGDAVITTDVNSRVAFMNSVAETLTGWTQQEAEGRTLPEVFRIVNETTRATVSDPTVRAAHEGVVVGLANHTLLIAKDGVERPIDDSAAPIRDEDGSIIGVVLVFRDVSERRKQETASARLAAIVASSHDAIISKALDGTITSWNDAAWRLYGYTEPEAIGKPVTMLIPPDRHGEERAILERIKRGERIDTYETIRKRKDGSIFNVELTVSPVRDKNGEIIGASKIARDITAQKRAAQALQESNSRFETLFKSCPVGMYLIDSDYKVRLASQSALPAFGDEGDPVGRDYTELIHRLTPPEEAEETVLRFRRTMETGEPFAASEWQVFRTDIGKHQFYNWQIHRIDLPNGKHGVVCYFFDVTESVNSRRAIQESSVRYRRLFESANDGMIIVDLETEKVVDANAGMSGLTGLEENDLVGRNLSKAGLFDDGDMTQVVLQQLRRSGSARREMMLHNVHGDHIAVEAVASVYHDGNRLVAQFNVRDIRDRYELERKIRQQTELLAGESRRKDEFLAMLSHELRNPLAPIRSAVYLLKMHDQSGADTVQRQAFEIIERQVTNLTKLVSDLLEVSRVVSGRIRLNTQTIDLKKVLEHALETSGPSIAERGHELIVHSRDDSVWVNGDATRIEEILINLLSNAAKYTDVGGTIEVTCEQPEDAEYVEIRVRDTGVGIDPDLLPRIFDLFTQSDRSLARSDGGLGVGLNLAHRLVEMHGGTIAAHSPPKGASRGSEFVVQLPVVAPPAVLAAPETNDRPRAPQRRRVLVVDDNVDQVSMLVSGLREKGYAVQSAYNGPDGLKAALQWHPDVVLLDIGLPGLNGYEVARRVRSALPEDREKMKLIALTGYGRDTDIALAHEAGFDVHLTKPCGFEELDKLLAESEA